MTAALTPCSCRCGVSCTCLLGAGCAHAAVGPRAEVGAALPRDADVGVTGRRCVGVTARPYEGTLAYCGCCTVLLGVRERCGVVALGSDACCGIARATTAGRQEYCTAGGTRSGLLSTDGSTSKYS